MNEAITLITHLTLCLIVDFGAQTNIMSQKIIK